MESTFSDHSWQTDKRSFLMGDHNGNHSVYVVRQWETVLQYNVISHWLGAYTEWSLDMSIIYNQHQDLNGTGSLNINNHDHDDVIKWKHFPRYWPFVRGIHRSPGEFPAQRPVTWSFDFFFDLRPNKRLSKQSWGWWFETASRPLWCHCNVLT